MDSRIEHIAKAVAEVYKVPQKRLLNLPEESNGVKGPTRECTTIYLYLLNGAFKNQRALARFIGVHHTTVLYHIRKAKSEIDIYADVANNYQAVLEILNSMKIKLNASQQDALLITFNEYLNTEPEDMAEELIMEHIDEIAEKLRKRLKKGTANMMLSSKEEKAFTIWYLQKGFFTTNPYARLTIQEVITQLKPIQKTQTV